jgi:hypothetical protein
MWLFYVPVTAGKGGELHPCELPAMIPKVEANPEYEEWLKA